MPDAPEGLRARKRRKTLIGIQSAAVRIALAEGIDAVTVDRVCAEVDVSRSTFFNYFPNRDAAIVGLPMEIIGGDEAYAVLDEHAPDVLKGVLALFFHSLGHMNFNADLARMRFELSEREPSVQRMKTVRTVETGARAIRVVTEWLELHPEHRRLAGSAEREATLSVNTVYVAVEAMTSVWRAAEGEIEATYPEFDEVLDELRVLLTPR